MSAKESRRVFVIEQAAKGKITNRQAAKILGLSERQVIRLKGRIKGEGVAGLAHKNRGRTPKHAVPKETKEKVVMLARGPLRDASCQQVAELLEEFYSITLSAKTIGRILKEAGILNKYGLTTISQSGYTHLKKYLETISPVPYNTNSKH